MMKSDAAVPVPPARLEETVIRHDKQFEEFLKRFERHDQLFEEIFKRFDKMEQEKNEEKKERAEEKRKKQERKDAEKQQREDEARKVEEENAQMWRVLEEGKYLQFFSQLMWTHKGIVYCTINHVKSE